MHVVECRSANSCGVARETSRAIRRWPESCCRRGQMITTTPAQGTTGLARDTAASLGHLIDQHVQVARVELAAELKELGRRARLVVVLAALVAVGYALAVAGLAVLFGGHA